MQKRMKRAAVQVVSNRCWSCDKGGRVRNYKLVKNDKVSVRAVHFTEKCINAAKEKYKVFQAGKTGASAKSKIS